MILKTTSKYYIICDLKLRELFKISKNNNKALVIKQFNIIGFIEE